MTDLLRPKNSPAVQIPGAQQAAMPMGNPMGGQTVADPIGGIKALFQGSNGTVNSSGINWDKYNYESLEDQAFKDLKKESGQLDQDSAPWYIAKVSQPMQMYITQLMYGNGPFYELYKATLNGFRLNESGMGCQVRDKFVNSVMAHPELNGIIGRNSSIMFGYRLIQIMKERNTMECTRNDYMAAAEIAVRNTLFFEMVSWLTRSNEGRQIALNLPNDLAGKVQNLDKFKSAVGSAYGYFNMTSPYEALTFQVQQVTRPDAAILPYVQSAATTWEGGAQSTANSDFSELEEWVRSRAGGYRPVTKNPGYQPDPYVQTQAWGNPRTDLEKLTPENRREFEIESYFHPLSKQNFYFVLETEWKHLKRAYKKHPEMGIEETVLPGCFRIVRIDLMKDTGWFSSIVRCPELDVKRILTNPDVLLPHLEMNEDQEAVVVAHTTEEVLPSDTYSEYLIPAEKVKELDKDVPVIVVTDPIVSNSSTELESISSLIASNLSASFNGLNGVSTRLTVKDTFSCQTKEEKENLFKEIPELFTNNAEENAKCSYYELVKRVSTKLRLSMEIGEELSKFITSKITEDFNNWLINECGHSPSKNGPNHLSVDDVVAQIDEVDEYFRNRYPTYYGKINEKNGSDFILLTQLMLFTEDEGDEDAKGINAFKAKHELKLERVFENLFVNNEVAPVHADDQPLIISRSRFPEYFNMFESAFRKRNKTKSLHGINSVEKILNFSDSDSRWLFSYSVYDQNTAILRHISRKRSMILMSFD